MARTTIRAAHWSRATLAMNASSNVMTMFLADHALATQSSAAGAVKVEKARYIRGLTMTMQIMSATEMTP